MTDLSQGNSVFVARSEFIRQMCIDAYEGKVRVEDKKRDDINNKHVGKINKICKKVLGVLPNKVYGNTIIYSAKYDDVTLYFYAEGNRVTGPMVEYNCERCNDTAYTNPLPTKVAIGEALVGKRMVYNHGFHDCKAIIRWKQQRGK